MIQAPIFEALNLARYELCHPVDEEYFYSLTDLIDGTPRAITWEPIKMVLIRGDKRHKRRTADAPWLTSSKLIFRPRVVLAMDKFLREFGELLPLACADENLVIYNPTRVIDALDEEASTVSRFKDGRVMMIEQHVFHQEKIKGVDVFKLPRRGSPAYLSQRFVDLWTSHGLTGLEFTPVK